MPRRYYSSTAARTTLAASVNSSTTSFSVVAVSGWPSSFPYTLIIDQDTVNEEIVEVTARSGTSLTVVRGVDGTVGVAHSAGAAVNHGVSARDFNEPNQFLNEGGTVTGSTVVSVSSGTGLEVRNTGTGNSFVVEDSANPDATPFVVDASGNVGIGTTAPGWQLHIASDSATTSAMVRSSSDAQGAIANFIKQRGSGASPSIVNSGDIIGQLQWWAHDGGQIRAAAAIRADVDGTPGSSDMPGRLLFFTTADGAATLTERMRITQAGNVGIGTSTPTARLVVRNDRAVNTYGLSIDTTNGASFENSLVYQFDGSNSIIGNFQNFPLSFITNNTERMRITSAGNVGIGTSSPSVELHVRDTTAGAAIYVEGAANASEVRYFRSNGSLASPTAVASGDVIGSSVYSGYDGAAYRVFAQIQGAADAGVGSGDAPGRLAFLTTADGGTTQNERMRIDNAGLITGTGTSLGAWTAYTPTLGGTGWAIGNGTVDGAYCQIGKIVHFRLRVTFGSTSTFGASANPTLSLPVTSKTSQSNNIIPYATVRDVSAGISYLCTTSYESTTAISLRSIGASGQLTSLNATSLFTWASADLMDVSGTYEAA